MKKGKKLLALLLSLCLLLTLLPFSALATEMPEAETEIQQPDAETIEPETEAAEAEAQTLDGEPQPPEKFTVEEIPVRVNPLYEGLIDPDTIPQPERIQRIPGEVYFPSATFTTEQKAGEQVRNYLKNRTETFTVYVKSESSDYNQIIENLLNIAFTHTGKPTEGDYLMWHWESYGGEIGWNYKNGYYEYELTFYFTYYTTAAQEKEVDTAVSNLLRTLNVTYKSDYQKVCAVYDYICDNVTYDYEHLEDTSYTRMFTAYAALIDKTAVCQGYALLFYRLMLELGVDTRLIAGEGLGVPHAWNIVKLGNVYYNVDSTWDAGMDEYSFFLRNTLNFPGHVRYLDYMSYEFHTEYPMSETDYVDGVKGVPERIYVYGICSDNVYWTLDREGNLIVFGEGPIGDYYLTNKLEDATPWTFWVEHITSVTIEPGVTMIGNYAFYDIPLLASVTIPGTVLSIGDYAFSRCDQLTTLELNEGLQSIGYFAFGACKSLESVVLPEGVTSLGHQVFDGCSSLKKLIIPESVTEVPHSGFSNCTSLETVELHKNISEIWSEAFLNCTSLKSIWFCGNAPYIWNSAFSGVTTTAYYPDGNATWTENVMQNYGGSITWVSYEHEHQWVKGDTVASSCTEDGYTIRTCTICDAEEKYDFVDALGHDIVKHEGKAPSGVHGGWAEYETCTRCDYTTYVELPPEYDVKFVGASLSLKGDIGLNFYAELSEKLLADTGAYMKFTGSGAARYMAVADGVLDESDGSYRYSVALNAKNMGDDVTAQVYNATGAVGDSSTLSIKYYADYVINNSNKEVFVNLMKAMLNYGAAAQTEFGYDTENLVNADMTEADRTLPEKLDVAKYAHTWSGEENGIEVTNASLLLQSETKIRIYFKLAEGKTLGDFTFTIDDVEVIPVQSGDEYYIEKTNVAAKDLDTMYTFCLGNRQLTYCGLSYVNQVLSYSSDADLLNLVKSLYAYNKAANAYFQPDEVEPPHVHTYAETVTEPTCTEDGYTTHTCTFCGDSYTDTETDALGHDWGEWTVTLEPTVDTEGEETRTCQREGCDETETRAIDKLPAEIEPPAEDNGEIDISGSSYADDVITYINEYRVATGLNPLTIDHDQFALVRAAELMISFSHTRPNGGTIYEYDWSSECIATGSNAKQVAQMWFESSSHNPTIMKATYKYAVAAYNGYCWVILLC